MKKLVSALVLTAMLLALAACGGGGGEKNDKPSGSDVETLKSEYGFQWTDPSAPILNDKGAGEISFNIYSSKNASALDYNDMKIMQDLFEQTNVNVVWENVSESVYGQQKNLIFGNADNRPDAIYHAGMGAGEIIKYAKRKTLLPISDYLEYMPNFSKILEERPDIKNQLTNKDATNFIADWVTKGLIDKVSFEQSQDNFLANGKGMETYGAFYWWESETVVSNPENYIVCNPLVGPNGEQTVCVSNSPEISTGEVVIFSECPNVEVLLAYLDRYYDPIISAQINYGPIGIVYEEERDANGMLVQKPVPEGMTTDELRLQNAPLGIIYLSDYAWENVVNMEPRAQLRVDRLTSYVKPFVPAGVQPCTNLQFTMDELNTLSNYETNLNDYIRTNLISWLMKGGVSDADWDNFQNELSGKVNLPAIQEVYQAAYDRLTAEG